MTVLVPEPLYGPAATVRARGLRWTRRYLDTGDWPATPMVDTGTAGGPILLSPPLPGAGAGPAAHCYLPAGEVTMAIATERAGPEVAGSAFAQWLRTDWGLAGLLAPVNVSWLRDPARYRPFLAALTPAWPRLLAEGDRFSAGSAHGQDIWSVPTNLTYVLANMGLAVRTLDRPRTAGEFAALVERTAGWDGVPAVDWTGEDR